MRCDEYIEIKPKPMSFSATAVPAYEWGRVDGVHLNYGGGGGGKHARCWDYVVLMDIRMFGLLCISARLDVVS